MSIDRSCHGERDTTLVVDGISCIDDEIHENLVKRFRPEFDFDVADVIHVETQFDSSWNESSDHGHHRLDLRADSNPAGGSGGSLVHRQQSSDETFGTFQGHLDLVQRLVGLLVFSPALQQLDPA